MDLEDIDAIKLLTIEQVLKLSVPELNSVLTICGLDCTGFQKPQLQTALLSFLGLSVASKVNLSSSSSGKASSKSSGKASPTEQSKKNAKDAEILEMEFRFKLKQLELEETRMKIEFERQREHEERQQRESEQIRLDQREREQRAHELAMKQLETGVSSVSNSTAGNRILPFRVDVAVKLIPKFTEQDVESFLIAFEKIAQLNSFPQDKYAAILQAQLTGRALKVFTELSLSDCQDYTKLKAALLTAYAVVPEVYRKRFRTANKSHSETYSEFGFRLSTLFKRCYDGTVSR